ncbi:MFS transporter [Paraburkholderia lycopersici]|uniref:MFS transporter, putative metabolite:H+ symporter n=1 Tax=Paraburkholderia lycopersici TaxID=416944 RepID=A0A1G6XAV7_9BURK|nr:MFS transporter [Paraburkholderia lycopersici]SDD74415.1 MFS transporter, putative metabolite:H+ symporter [Paraburkholderia lycopersici]
MQTTSPNAGARLDRLPVSRFHWRIVGLVAGGMFLDGFEIYLGAAVLSALLKSGWSDLAHNAQFVSLTFAGMVLGAWLAGVLGDRYGRRFSYQANLLLFGVASLAGACAPNMTWLVSARFFMGIGLGAEIVVGYVTVSEFVPPAQRGRWGSALSALTNLSLFVSALLGYLIIPRYGWRWMFVIVGTGALVVWYLRKKMPESPRWLEAHGRNDEAERVLAAIEAEAGNVQSLPPVSPQLRQPRRQRPFTALFSRALIRRTLVASVILIVLNTVIYGFIAWIPSFMAKSGMSIVSSLGFATLMSLGGPVGGVIGMLSGDRVGRKPGNVIFSALAIVLGALYPNVSAPALLAVIGFALVTTIYAMVAFAWALYVPELFPTDLRMRGSGFCNTLGRLMTVLTPWLVVWLYGRYQLPGVVAAMLGLLVVQILVVAVFGIETRGFSLETLAPEEDADASNQSLSALVSGSHGQES